MRTSLHIPVSSAPSPLFHTLPPSLPCLPSLFPHSPQISFRSELAASLRTKGDAVSALGEARQAVDELRQDNAELQVGVRVGQQEGD